MWVQVLRRDQYGRIVSLGAHGEQSRKFTTLTSRETGRCTSHPSVDIPGHPTTNSHASKGNGGSIRFRRWRVWEMGYRGDEKGGEGGKVGPAWEADSAHPRS